MLASQVAADGEFLRRKLPPQAFEKLLSLIGREDALVASYGQIYDQQQPLHRRLQIAEEKFRQLEAAPVHSPMFARQKDGGFSYTPPQEREAELRRDRDKIVGAARTERDAARDELARLDAQAASIKQRMSPVASRAVGWVRGLPDDLKIRMNDWPVKPPAGDDLAKAVEALRARITQLQQNVELVQNAPWPREDAKRIVQEWVNNLGRAIDVRPTVEFGRAPAVPLSVVPLAGAQSFPMGDVMSTLAWVCKDMLLEKLFAEIDRLVDPNVEALGTRQRERRIAELQTQRLSIERQEEAAIQAAEQQRVEIKRRDTANPIAILNLNDDLLALTA